MNFQFLIVRTLSGLQIMCGIYNVPMQQTFLSLPIGCQEYFRKKIIDIGHTAFPVKCIKKI